MTDKTYDIAIVGGGLAGLALAIQLRRKGHSVVIFEKEQYPFHKVCGEYISLESWDFLNDLGIDLDKMKVPVITKLRISAVNGKMIEQALSLGGFGISRYRLDHTLAQIATAEGATIIERTKVNDIVNKKDVFIINTSLQQYQAKLVCGSYGKRSNLDVKWKRSFLVKAKSKLNNYIGVKYHIQTDFPADTIALHNFKNGYCGVVKIEDDKYNLCYLTTAANLKKSNGDIKKMEESFLYQNPHLKKIFTTSEFITEPLTISQISFDKKSLVENHMLMIGDAAGMITPLCGNGMSMALHGSMIAAKHIHEFLQKNSTREEMEKQYNLEWNRHFARRLKAGQRIQRLFGGKRLTNLLITLVRPFPKLINYLVSQTHGQPY